MNIIVPSRRLVRGEVRDVYMLDLRQLTDEQTANLIEHLSNKFHIPLAVVKRDLPQIGVPILADDLNVTTDQMFFL